MVSIPLCSPSPTLLSLSRGPSTLLPSPSPFPPPHRRPGGAFLRRAVGIPPTPSSSGPESQRQAQNPKQKQQVRTLFPGGFKRAEIKSPTLVLSLAVDEVLGNELSLAAVDTAVAKGAVGIVLLSGGAEGGLLYEAACALKALIEDRAYLVIEERVDIAAAVGASGVLLSDHGLPAIIARNMMSKSTAESVLLPIVARNVEVDGALIASRYEGADFLVIGTTLDDCSKNFEKFLIQDVKIPIFIKISGNAGGDSFFRIVSQMMEAGVSGLVLSIYDLELFGDDILKKLFSISHGTIIQIPIDQSQSSIEVSNTAHGSHEKRLVAGFSKLSDAEIKLVEEERHALQEAVSVMQKAVPLMNEISLLVDAIAWLDQPFLLAVVGEFNSGKSSVINALLGKRCLREGVVPTTNEVTFLCYSDMEAVGTESCEKHPDGQLMCYLPAPILREMNIVDTPGTNVILQRQQRLTEEFIPRADLVLFVLSSDRPLTESEVAFLLYIRQWKKNVLFVLNKSDLYCSSSELEEAMSFVKENVGKLLNTKDVILFPVSARLALQAKLPAVAFTGQRNPKDLADDPCWRSSGFIELENFLFSFLDGSTDTGMKRMKLKLETPIAIADRLLAASESLLHQEYECACEDLASVNNIVDSVRQCALRLENESASWRKQALSLVQAAKVRTVKLVKSILQLSNIDLILIYALRTEKTSSLSATSSIQDEIISPAISDAQKLLEEYSQWLQSSASQECQNYIESFDNRWPGSANDAKLAQKNINASLDWQVNLSKCIIEKFSASAASRLFELEIQEIALGTYGGLGAAGVSASLLTSVLQTTLEDLLALGLCSAGGLLAVSSFPARRKSMIEKIERVADGLAQQMEEAMREDSSKTAEQIEKFVISLAKPYKEAAQEKIDRLTELKRQTSFAGQNIQIIKTAIQNLHSQ